MYKEWKGEFVCIDCHNDMIAFDKEFKESGLTHDRFFKRKMLDFVEKRFSKFARGN